VSHSVSEELFMRIPAAFARALCFCCVCLLGIAAACMAQTQQGSQSSGGASSLAQKSTNAPGAAVAAAPIDPQFKANIMKLLDVTHAMAIGQQAAKTMFAQLRPTLVASLPPTPHREQIVDAYSEKLTALLVGPEVVDRLAGVYARHLSPDDVNAMIQFYATPAGQHALASMPQIMAESQQIGANAAEENIPRIFGQLCTEFPELRGKVKFCPAGTQNESGERREGAGKALHARGEVLPAQLERVSYSHANSVTQQSAPPKAAVNAADPNEEPVNVPEDVMVRKIVHQVNPGFPTRAAAAHVSGTVTMEVLVGKDGKVESVKAISGPDLLRDWATAAVRQWVFKPTKMKGKLVEVRTKIFITYTPGE
jgi:TonB family protein